MCVIIGQKDSGNSLKAVITGKEYGLKSAKVRLTGQSLGKYRMWDFWCPLHMGSGHVTFLALIWGSLHGVLPTREAPLGLGIQSLYWGSICGWLIAHVVDLSFQVSWYCMAQSPTPHWTVSLSCVASHRQKSHCQLKTKARPLLGKVKFFATHHPSLKIHLFFGFTIEKWLSLLDHGEDKGLWGSSLNLDSFLGKIPLNTRLFLPLASEEEPIPLSTSLCICPAVCLLRDKHLVSYSHLPLCVSSFAGFFASFYRHVLVFIIVALLIYFIPLLKNLQ